MLNKLLTQVYAQTTAPASSGVPADKELGVGSNFVTDFGQLITWITNIIIVVGSGITVVMLALGFIRYITSQGDKTAVDTAQKWLTYAVVGGVGLLLVFALKSVIFSLAGISADPLETY